MPWFFSKCFLMFLFGVFCCFRRLRRTGRNTSRTERMYGCDWSTSRRWTIHTRYDSGEYVGWREWWILWWCQYYYSRYLVVGQWDGRSHPSVILSCQNSDQSQNVGFYWKLFQIVFWAKKSGSPHCGWLLGQKCQYPLVEDIGNFTNFFWYVV